MYIKQNSDNQVVSNYSGLKGVKLLSLRCGLLALQYILKISRLARLHFKCTKSRQKLNGLDTIQKPGSKLAMPLGKQGHNKPL
jgi:hypothetical protein